MLFLLERTKLMKLFHRTQQNRGDRAQAMVEFALVLPILIAILIGIFEVGRLIFTYAAVNNASREAVRYASAIGLDDSGNLKYQYCDGIREMARRSAFFTPLTITISYDHGPGTTPFDTCTGSVDTGIVLNSGSAQDRVEIEVKATYKPLTKLLPIGDHEFESRSARTIIGLVEIDSIPGTPNTATSVSFSTAASTLTPTPSATFTSTSTTTATFDVVAYTFTPLPTSTPTPIPSGTPTATSTETATPTATATGTSTPSSSCDTISANDISVTDSTNSISMTIMNPYIDVTVSSITLEWNNNAAQGSSGTLTLDDTNLGTTFWSGLNNSSGKVTLTPSSTLTLPGNNAKSKIIFTFLQSYDALKMTGTTITVNFSTPGCSAITKTVP